MHRFDVVDILVDYEAKETMFCVILGIINLSRSETNTARYICGQVVVSVIDTVIIAVQLQKINVRKEGQLDYNFFHTLCTNIVRILETDLLLIHSVWKVFSAQHAALKCTVEMVVPWRLQNI